jgi:hypothetical protein
MVASGAVCGCPPRVRTSRELSCGRMRRPACRRLLYAGDSGNPRPAASRTPYAAAQDPDPGLRGEARNHKDYTLISLLLA